MKRKFKLVSSIASLSLAVLMLAAGVFAAAQTRQVELAGSVAFTAQNVRATIEVTEGSALTEGAIALGNAQTHNFYVAGDAQYVDSATSQAGEDFALTPALNDDAYVYQYQIVITNNFTDKDIYATLSLVGTTGLPTGLTVATEVDGLSATRVAIGAGLSKTVVVTYTVNVDEATTIAATNIGALVSLFSTAS